MEVLDTPYSVEGTWLRGNLHTHSTESDGVRAPERVIDDYEARNYDFLALSDHDVLVDPERYHQQTGLLLLPAVEVSANGPHLLHIGANEAVAPFEDRAAVIETIEQGSGFAVLAHPHWGETFEHWSIDELHRLDGATGIEIYNADIEIATGSPDATDCWDQLLAAGEQCWGYANDDAHYPWQVARAWNVVQVDRQSPEAILESLRTGRFYASTGVTVESIRSSGNQLHIETSDATEIQLYSDYGVLQQTCPGSSATFRLPEQLVHGSDHTYVRIECVGRGSERAWLQPMRFA